MPVSAMNRRRFIQTLGAGAACLTAPLIFSQKPSDSRWNLLFIAIDDLNDWIGCLGGHPDTRTPNLDRLAARGVLFTHAYCAAPACNPSRASLLTGIRPSSSGVYNNSQPWRTSPVLKDAVTLPQHFQAHGYQTMGSGKIYHDAFPDPASWNRYWPSLQRQRPADPLPAGRPLNGIPDVAHFDWGSLPNRKEEMGDWKVGDRVIEELRKKHDTPFFLACGFFKPHLPWYVPQEYFNPFTVDKIALPTINENDLDDVPEAGRRMAKPNGDHAKVIKYHQWRKAVQGYLASIHFADACLGRVIDALDRSPYHDNTAVVLWSDHGWHLGEKLHWRKFALWEEATHNVLMMSIPGLTKAGGRCDATVNLLDIYPTLVEAFGMTPVRALEGVSLMPLLKNPQADWQRPALTTHGRNNHSVRSRRWRYIRYENGSEELYDHDKDELEWTNLANDSRFASVKQDLAQWMPGVNTENVPEVKESGDY